MYIHRQYTYTFYLYILATFTNNKTNSITQTVRVVSLFAKFKISYNCCFQDMNEPSCFNTNGKKPWNWPEDAKPYWSLKCYANNSLEFPPYKTSKINIIFLYELYKVSLYGLQRLQKNIAGIMVFAMSFVNSNAISYFEYVFMIYQKKISAGFSAAKVTFDMFLLISTYIVYWILFPFICLYAICISFLALEVNVNLILGNIQHCILSGLHLILLSCHSEQQGLGESVTKTRRRTDFDVCFCKYSMQIVIQCCFFMMCRGTLG